MFKPVTPCMPNRLNSHPPITAPTIPRPISKKNPSPVLLTNLLPMNPAIRPSTIQETIDMVCCPFPRCCELGSGNYPFIFGDVRGAARLPRRRSYTPRSAMTSSGGRGLASPARTRAWVIREHDTVSKRAPRRCKCLSGRCERLSLLHDIGNKNSGLGVARLTTRVRCFGRYLEGIACFDCASRLTLYGKLKAAFQDIGGFDSWMRVSRDGCPRLYCRFYKKCHIARRRTICLRQNLSRDAGRRCGCRTLGHRFGGNQLGNSAERARR